MKKTALGRRKVQEGDEELPFHPATRFGQPGVDVHVRHDMDGPPGSAAILHLQFLVNEGFLISATADDTLHLWSHKQKVPQIVQSLKFQKEKISYMHLPLQSKWMYVGTVKGNVHVVQIETFSLSGYIINWNKTIELTMKTHPGAIVHLSDNPLDASKLLIGYESGQIVLWDLRSRNIEMRWLAYDLRSISWHYEGKQFMCAHADGTLTTWNIRNSQKYVHISQPHAKFNKDGKPEQCKPIGKVEWKTNRAGEAFVIFSGGMPYDQACRTPSITVVHNKTTTVLEMEHNVIDFVTLCESPYISDMQEPFAIIALLQNDLVVVDLQTPGYPWIENPYPMNIHESPVTCVSYLADCPVDLIPAFYSVGRAGSSKRQGLSEMDWPINGGTWSAQGCSYAEVILTGHADGSIKFWDASAGTLQVLYKLKTSKIFEKPKSRSTESEEDPFAINLISLCPESRKLCVAGASSHVMLFTYKKTESSDEVMVLEIPIVYEVIEDEISPDCQFSGPGSAGSGNKLDLLDLENKREGCTLKVRTGAQKKPAGFQAQLVCLTPWNNGEPPSHITALTINSSYGLMAYGNEAGLVIVDIEQRVCLLNVGSPDLYGAQDPYYRVPRSPKKNQVVPEAIPLDFERQPRSPSIDQVEQFSRVKSPTQVQENHTQSELSSGQMSPEMDENIDADFESFANQNSAIRPDNLDLLDEYSGPIRPPRGVRKKSRKEGERLLSVPNVKSLRNEGQTLRDLRDKEDMLTSPQPSFTGNFMRRFKDYKGCVLTLHGVALAIFRGPFSAVQRPRQASPMGTPPIQMGGSQPPIATSVTSCRPRPEPPRRSRSQGTRKLHKCLSTASYSEDQSYYSGVGIMPPLGAAQGLAVPAPDRLTKQQIARTFGFSNRGHGLYLASPSELQKFTLCSDFCSDLSEMLGELFLTCDMPEPPKVGFFKGLFGGGSSQLDREELFGESSGKANKAIAKHIPGSMQDVAQRASTASGEVNRAHKLMLERGDKLSQLEDRAERMRNEAENFSSSAHDLMNKYKDKKWYQL
ncbi:hypothetical protein HUJ04_006241 [Dendroctonus ponderosae]|nr:hypothetical protein HUJ04_006241 [Dendroctonus ponderosae]